MTAQTARLVWRTVRAQQTRRRSALCARNWRTCRDVAKASRRARVKCVRLLAEAFGVGEPAPLRRDSAPPAIGLVKARFA
jgi:hypothetical protein